MSIAASTTTERNLLAATVLLGDCRELLNAQSPDTADGCVTDAPYEIGFMGKSWDASGVAFDPATWAAVLRVLKPGAYLLAFGGTRSHHRMTCAIEDAGFEIRDELSWVYASGFPKNKHCQLKPAHEPIVLARKPLSESSIAANVERWGTGALNIDACRVTRAAGDVPGWHQTGANGAKGYRGSETFRTRDMDAAEIQERCGGGRWPANLILNHTLFCDEEGCAPGCPVALLDAQSGESRSTGGTGEASKRKGGTLGWTPSNTGGFGDSGGASRFFHCLPWDPLDEPTPFFYVAKPAKSERNHGCDSLPLQTRNRVNPGGLEHDPKWAPTQVQNHHPTVKPVSLMRLLARLICPAEGLVLDPFTGSGTTGVAAMREGLGFLGMELHPPYAEIARARLLAERNLFGDTGE